MLKSMTGYGSGKVSTASGLVTVEIRSLNYRYLEVIVRLPENILCFEKKVKQLAQQKIRRGRVNINLNFESHNEDNFRIEINKKLATGYLNGLEKLKKEFKFKESITLPQLLSFPDVLVYKRKNTYLEREWPRIKKAVGAALDSLIKSRGLEGRFMYNDLYKRTRIIESLLLKIEKRIPLMLNKYKKRLLRRFQRPHMKTVKSERLESDFASFVQGCDVSEEITRVKAHVKNFKQVLKANEEVGKKLDFIAQELSREANTIAAKTQDFTVSKSVIEIKAEIEKIREQAQNVE